MRHKVGMRTMNSRERVRATLDFQDPDRLPTDLWALPSTWFGREEPVNALLACYPTDFAGVGVEHLFTITGYTRGTYVDEWGCEWVNLQDGVIGEVKGFPLDDYATLATYGWPEPVFGPQWAEVESGLAKLRDKFTLGQAGNLFERMQFLRGPEALYADLADPDCGEVYELRDRVCGMIRRYVEQWARTSVDAISFSDDWGSQRSLLISPVTWRAFFRPKYQELFDIVRNAGKRIFFHSDGWILDLYPEFIGMGVNAINSQVWCMGLDRVAPFAGQITFWGELDRQQMLPRGTPAEIRRAARQMFDTFYRHGGLIGQASVDKLSSLENLEAAVAAWWEIELPR